MGKFDGILICTDLDGTLLRDDKTVSKENLEAIEYFKSEGGLFTFITGRMPYFSRQIRDTVRPNAPIGCINGGGIYDYERDEYLMLNVLPQDVSELVVDVADALPGIGVIVNTPDKLYFPYDNMATAKHRALTGMPYADADIRSFDKQIAKIVFTDLSTDTMDEVMRILNCHKRHSEFDFIRSEKHLYEILPKGNSKGNVLMKMAELLGIDKRRTVALGDYNNDISMLSAAGVGIAVKNATNEAKAAADRITVSNEEHAIKRTVEEIEAGIISFV